MKGGTRKRGKTWSYYFDTAQINGKRKKIEKGGFRTKKEAETALAKAIAEYESSGQVFQPSTISVSVMTKGQEMESSGLSRLA